MASGSEPPFVPNAFEPPDGLTTDEFILEPLGPKHNESDLEAWASSISHIHATPGFAGWSWPVRRFTLDENLADLVEHADEFETRRGFAYTVLDPTSRVVIGCVYFDPPRRPGVDVVVHSWVTASRASLDVALYKTVTDWLKDSWPWSLPEYAPRLSYLEFPGHGRLFTTEYQVRLGDAAPSGRMHFDAIARCLQDVAEDDANDAGWPKSIGWLLRRCALTVRQFPVLGERVRLDTFCSAAASKWAERTTTITGDKGGSLQASAIWIAVDATSGRPTRVGELFDRLYAPSTDGRRASVRLSLPPPAANLALADARSWPIRSTDLDVLGHVNNATSWSAVEDEMSLLDWLPQRAEVEHNGEITIHDSPRLMSRTTDTGLDVWLVDEGRVLTSARLHSRGDARV